MTETVVTTVDDGDEGEGQLAQAAVASTMVSGAAIERATTATETAEEANARAQGAQATADAALGVASTSVSAEEARRIAREEYDLARNAELSVEVEPAEPVEVVEVDELPEQVLPKSARKAAGENPENDGKKGTWAQRHGLVS